MEATLQNRNDGSIWNSDYDPDNDTEIVRLRKIAEEHTRGELADLTEEEWLLLLDNDIKTLYALRGDAADSPNPHKFSFPGSLDVQNISPLDLSKTQWLRILKWDVSEFNRKVGEWFKATSKNEDGSVVETLDLSNSYLRGAMLAGANLHRVNLMRSNLSDANLENSDLSHAELYSANLSGADLRKANLSNAVLIKSDLSYAIMFETDLSNAGLSKANLSNSGLAKANLFNAVLIKANLANIRAGDANFGHAHLEEADLTGAVLNLADLSFSNLSKTNMSNAFLYEANLSNANLKKAKLHETHLGQVNLSGANLEAADMSGAHLAGAIIDDTTKFDPVTLRGADLREINFSARKFSHCQDALQVDFDGCIFQKVYFRYTILGEMMIRECAYGWGLKKMRDRHNGRPDYTQEDGSIAEEAYSRLFHIHTEEELTYSGLAKMVQKAGETYLNLKANWQDIGYYDDASWAAVREKECERKAAYALIQAEKNNELDDDQREYFNNRRSTNKVRFRVSNLLKWTGYSLFNALCQYGENPLRLTYWAAGLILFFAFLYPVTGITGESHGAAGEYLSDNIINYASGTPVTETFQNAGRFLYYSVITFTTVGYGDFRPYGWFSHILAMMEAFIGVFMIGLFIWCLGRRVGAR